MIEDMGIRSVSGWTPLEPDVEVQPRHRPKVSERVPDTNERKNLVILSAENNIQSNVYIHAVARRSERAEDADAGTTAFQPRCADCHGEDGGSSQSNHER